MADEFILDFLQGITKPLTEEEKAKEWMKKKYPGLFPKYETDKSKGEK